MLLFKVVMDGKFLYLLVLYFYFRYNYDLEANTIVEEEWQKYIANRAMCDVRAVKSGTFEYSVDFMSWTQTNIKHYNHKVRKIRRLDEKRNVTVNPYQNQN